MLRLALSKNNNFILTFNSEIQVGSRSPQILMLFNNFRKKVWELNSVSVIY